MKRTSHYVIMCVALFYQTEWFNNRSEKSSENCLQLVLLFCEEYLFLVLLARCSQLASDYSAHFLFMPAGAPAWGPRGVWGLLSPWYWYFAFFSLGFKIWEESDDWTRPGERCGDFYLEGAHQCLVHRHHPAGIVELSTVVGGWEQSDQLPLGEKLVSVLDNLEGLCCVTLLLLCWVLCFPRV